MGRILPEAAAKKIPPECSPGCGRETIRAHGWSITDVTASVLLVIGYSVALAVLTRLRPVLTERRVWWFLALEAATVSITAGWLLRGRPLAAALNGAALVGFAIGWWITGRRAGRPRRESR